MRREQIRIRTHLPVRAPSPPRVTPPQRAGMPGSVSHTTRSQAGAGGVRRERGGAGGRQAGWLVRPHCWWVRPRGHPDTSRGPATGSRCLCTSVAPAGQPIGCLGSGARRTRTASGVSGAGRSAGMSGPPQRRTGRRRESGRGSRPTPRCGCRRHHGWRDPRRSGRGVPSTPASATPGPASRSLRRGRW